MFKTLLFRALLILFVSGAAACGSTTTTPTTGVIATTTYVSRIQEKGSAWRSFQVPTAGTVTVQLTSLTQGDAVVRLSLGTVSGTNCIASQSIDTVATSAASSPQISTTLAIGTYCVRIADIGNLTMMVDFSVTIVTPY